MIAKLDRLSRNVALIANLMEDGVDFVAVDMPEANRLTIHILAAVAEHERYMISRRTKEALASAKSRGVRLGSPAPQKGARVAAKRYRDMADRHAANVQPLIREIEGAGATSLRAIAEALNARGVPTARGGKWGPQAVANVKARSIERAAT